MSDAGHPSRHGYERCTHCGTWRRVADLDTGPNGATCAEVDWCLAQKARVEAGKGAPAQFRAVAHAGSPEAKEGAP